MTEPSGGASRGGPAREGLLDTLVLPEGLSGADDGERRGWRPSWWRRLGTLLIWALAQGVFLIVPPLVGLVFNLAAAATFVWWFALRSGPSARHRRSVFRLRGLTAQAAAHVPLVAVPLVGLVLTSLVVMPRIIPFPPPRVDPLEAYLRKPNAIFTVLVLVAVIAPLIEEFLFRGWIQRSLERRMPAMRAIALTAALFSAVHMEAFGFPIRFAFGLVAGYAAWSTRSIWPGVVLHGLYNASLVVAGTLTESVDETVLTRWSNTPSIFWPVALAFVACALLLVAALRSLERAARAGRPVRAVRAANAA